MLYRSVLYIYVYIYVYIAMYMRRYVYTYTHTFVRTLWLYRPLPPVRPTSNTPVSAPRTTSVLRGCCRVAREDLKREHIYIYIYIYIYTYIYNIYMYMYKAYMYKDREREREREREGGRERADKVAVPKP